MKTLFKAEQFTPTQWETAEQKAKFANHFVRFVESGFKETIFPDWFYKRLSMTFGHIAHYDKAGFYHEFFTTTANQRWFLSKTEKAWIVGDPKYTYSDVEKVLAEWVKEQGLVETYTAKFNAETANKERALLAMLKAKYPEA